MTSDFFQNGLQAYQKIFWPTFVEYNDCVFLAFDELVYLQWIQKAEGDKGLVEKIMNHRHIADLLPEAVESPTSSLVIAFGKLLRDAWEAKLLRDFPTKRFCVNFSTEEQKNLTDYEITFYQL